jgi:hypothetical protein
MKIQLFLLGAVAALTVGALSVAGSVPVASRIASPARTSSPSPSPSPEASPEVSTATVIVPVIATDTPTPATSPSAHPCNHGFYVAQVAHGHHGGKFTSSVAKSDIGKDGDCTKPVPTPTTDATSSPTVGADANHESGDQSETEVETDSD